jgi:hypothetical protein
LTPFIAPQRPVSGESFAIVAFLFLTSAWLYGNIAALKALSRLAM